MARKNRVSVYDGVYHVTTRIANRAMLLKPDEVKERLMKWIVSVANFSGVEVWGFTVMDNHLHLIVHVPPVPKEYWLDANDEPAAYAFGMRPPECRVPLWNGDSPSLESLRIGDSPSPGSVASSAAVGPKETRTSGDGDSPRRPPKEGLSPLSSKTGAYILADFGFLKEVRDFLPRHFPKAGRRSASASQRLNCWPRGTHK